MLIEGNNCFLIIFQVAEFCDSYYPLDCSIVRFIYYPRWFPFPTTEKPKLENVKFDNREKRMNNTDAWVRCKSPRKKVHSWSGWLYGLIQYICWIDGAHLQVDRLIRAVQFFRLIIWVDCNKKGFSFNCLSHEFVFKCDPNHTETGRMNSLGILNPPVK